MPKLAPNIQFLGEVDTTMVAALQFLPQANGKPFGVVAETQLKGRGTGGRTWISPRGNLYFTLCIPQSNPTYLNPKLMPVMPLICGLACRRAVLQLLPGIPAERVTTKWPNDLIYQQKKICGTLVESEEDYFLVGMGVNVDVAPTVTDAGREATTLNQIAKDLGLPPTTPKALANAVWEQMFDITMNQSATREDVVREFDQVMDRTLKLHKRLPNGRDPEELTPVSLNSWGHLTVRHVDGKEETLCAEYLF